MCSLRCPAIDLLGPWLSSVHPRYRTPHHATYLTGIAVAILAAFIPIGDAADMTNIGTLFAFVLVCIGVVVLRYTKPNYPRPFRVPLMPIIPILGMLACLGLMTFLPMLTWIRFIVWTIIGMIVYLFYGSRHSRLTVQSQEIPGHPLSAEKRGPSPHSDIRLGRRLEVPGRETGASDDDVFSAPEMAVRLARHRTEEAGFWGRCGRCSR